jgi:hypothetical protein
VDVIDTDHHFGAAEDPVASDSIGDPITPGSVLRDVAKVPDTNAPDAYRDLIDAVSRITCRSS